MNAGDIYGRGIAFPPHIGPDGRWAWSEGAQNIREAIQIILLTEAGERLMLATFGGGLRRFLFEPNTATTRRLIQERVSEALRLWEPRIRVGAVRVQPVTDATGQPDDREVTITIEYTLVATRAGGQVSLTLPVGQ